jgi:hypothetical protein
VRMTLKGVREMPDIGSPRERVTDHAVTLERPKHGRERTGLSQGTLWPWLLL